MVSDKLNVFFAKNKYNTYIWILTRNMKKHLTLFVMLVTAIKSSIAQIPVEEYKKEILSLKTEQEIDNYWTKLHKIDQEILVETASIQAVDSISISNMIRTALLFKIHGKKAYKPTNTVPILNMSHNYIGGCQLAFWPVIEKCKEVGGIIENFGGKFPAYQLEGIALTFYNYSLLGQQAKYEGLLEKLNHLKDNSLVEDLEACFKYQKELQGLREIEVLGKWHLQPFKNVMEEEFFEFVRMSDESIYIKKRGHIQKLELIEPGEKTKIYRITDEPFGWTYAYGNDGSLVLRDEKKENLIEYTRIK